MDYFNDFQVNTLIERFIVKKLQPISLVEDPYFIELIEGLSGVKPMSRHTFKSHLLDKMLSIKSNMIATFEKQPWVCTTADIWSANNKSYMGVTCHFIDENYQRKSYMLSCKRIMFAHIHSVIANALYEIHKEFNLKSKVVGTITDNAANFAKAFKVFQIKQSISLPDDPDTLDDPETSILTIDFDSNVHDEVSLPKQFRCIAHTLNLLASHDSLEAQNDESYCKIYTSTFRKITDIWNLVSRSTKAADIFYEICKCRLKIPCKTRWNSYYDSIKALLNVKDKLENVCEKLEKPKFTDNQISFMEEYIKVMEPIASALDFLQGDKNSCFGHVLPVLLQIKQQFKKLKHLRFCTILNDTLLTAMEKRFGNIIDMTNTYSRYYILTTVTTPKFKLKWLAMSNCQNAKEFCENVLIKEAQSFLCEDVNNLEKSLSSSEEDTFFSFLHNKDVSLDNIDTISGGTESLEMLSTVKLQCLTYLSDKSKDLNTLDKYLIIKQIYIKYNTLLPSSAPVERIFSVAQQILTPRRNNLSDDNFECLMFLKHNS